MKAIITIVLSIVTFITNAQIKELATSNTNTITVTVPVVSQEGKIVLGLYNEATFMKAAPIVGLVGEIKDGKAVVTFKDIKPGVYAISIFHDLNSNNKMDFEANGMPKEDYGTSNNVKNYGPPMWSDAKFEVTNKNIEMVIKL